MSTIKQWQKAKKEYIDLETKIEKNKNAKKFNANKHIMLCGKMMTLEKKINNMKDVKQ